MKNPKRKINYREHEGPEEQFPDIPGAASATELTGLMYRAPTDQEEWDSYQELYPMAIPKNKPAEKK